MGGGGDEGWRHLRDGRRRCDLFNWSLVTPTIFSQPDQPQRPALAAAARHGHCAAELCHSCCARTRFRCFQGGTQSRGPLARTGCSASDRFQTYEHVRSHVRFSDVGMSTQHRVRIRRVWRHDVIASNHRLVRRRGASWHVIAKLRTGATRAPRGKGAGRTGSHGTCTAITAANRTWAASTSRDGGQR